MKRKLVFKVNVYSITQLTIKFIYNKKININNMKKKRFPDLDFSKSILLSDILKLHIELYKQGITKTHYLIVISGVILSFVINEIFKKSFLEQPSLFRLGVIIIMAGTLLTILFSLSAIELTTKKSRKRINIFFHTHETGKLDEKRYEKELLRLVNNDKEIVQEYAQEIFELEQLIKKQFDAIKIGTFTLIGCCLVGGVMVLINLFL